MADETRRGMHGAPEDAYGGALGGDGRLLSEYTRADVRDEGRRIAASYLENRGYSIVDELWECPVGAAIVASKGGDDPDSTSGGVVVVEVGTELRFDLGPDSMPELDVDDERRRRLRSLALFYLATHPDLPCVRADVIALNIVAERTARVRHLVGAFGYAA